MKKTNAKSLSTKNHFSPTTVVMLVVLIVYAAILFGLLLWALLTSFKIQDDFDVNTWKLPTEWYITFPAIFKFSVPVDTDMGTRFVKIDRKSVV